MAIELNVTVKNINAVLSALTAHEEKFEQATAYAVGQVALAFEAQAKRNFQGVHTRSGNSWTPSGHITGSPDYPNVRTGNLRRSITTTFKREGFGSYSASVSPTMVYSRAVELGNGKGGAGYPYMEPAYRRVLPQVNTLFVQAAARKLR
jgi:hypothetical protein